MAQTKLTDWFPWQAGAKRRDLAALKRRVYEDDFAPLVVRHIRHRIDDPDAAWEIEKYASETVNLGRVVVETVACGYSKGVRRVLDAVSPEVSRAFADVIVECGFDRWATKVAHHMWWMGPTFIAPTVSPRTLKLRLDIVTPDHAECTRYAPDELKALVWQRADDKALVYVDEAEWRFFDARGEELDVAPVPHLQGKVPVATFRDSFPGAFDWWDTRKGWGLYGATLDVAMKVAVMQYRRLVSNKVPVMYGPLDTIPEGQSMAVPMRAVHATGGISTNKLEMVDLTMPVADMLAEIYALIGLAVSRFAIPPSDVSFEQSNSQWGSYALSIRKEKLGHLRNDQVKHLRPSEEELWPLICDVVRASRLHKYARVLPPGDEVRDMLDLRFSDYADTEESKKRIELMEARLRHGLDHPRDVLLEERPELSSEDADAIIEENLSALADRNDTKVQRNTADPGKGLQSAAQVNGSIGGSTRAANAAHLEDTE